MQESKGHLYRQCKNRMIVHRHIWRGRYEHLKTSLSGKMRGEAATVEEVTPGVWKVCLVATHTVCPELPCNFINVLKGWGHTWIWDDLKVTGGTDWIAQATAEGTLVAVTDGLYIR